MDRLPILICIAALTCILHCQGEGETVLSAVLTPNEKSLLRQGRSYYERYGYGRPYDRLDDRPSRCGRCDDDDDDDDDDYDRGRGRDDDRRSNRPTYGSRNDKNDRNKYDDDDNRRYDDRNDRNNKNGTDDSDDRKHNDDKDEKPHRRRNKNRNRYDERDRYRPDYYDRFLRDPYRDRYDDPYRRPAYDRYYPDRYDDYGRDGYYSSSGYRRPLYEDRYDRGSGYLDGYGGYGPGVGRGPHERPWDETYRGQAGWDSAGRGYYFASGRPDSTAWGQQQYARPATSSGGLQNVGYTTGYSGGYSGYRDPVYRGSAYAGAAGGYQDLNAGGYSQSSGWRNVGERRPYRDQSGVAHLDTKVTQEQAPTYDRYGQNRPSYQPNTYSPQSGSYSQSSSSTPGTSYLFQREDEVVTQPDTTVPPA
ncbi:jg24011 [Pararge aegeria aegeria]|uniref:Jg24011 protein n=1 Tax=Pararge aegeria aegeria TaxID=348720 RepID=A0A8S4SEE7_9NEOP|nr:jg24011 [Pararge aegeria aegeria]